MNLAELQRLFWRAVRHDPMPSEVDQHFLDHGPLAAQARMKIYQDAYWFRQVDALFECFPKLAEALGPEVFTRAVCRYLTEHPSDTPVLELLGRRLSDWLRLQEDPSLAGLADLAALEHARLQVLLAPPMRSIATPSDINPETFAACRIEPSPALLLLTLRRDALLRWEHPATSTTNPAVVHVVAWREGFRVLHQALDPVEGTALRLALDGASMAEVFDAFADLPEPEVRAFQALSSWLNHHWICSFCPPPSP